MRDKQLTLDDIDVIGQQPKTKIRESDRAFLIGANALMHQWKIPPKTRNLALGILNHGAQIPNTDDRSDL